MNKLLSSILALGAAAQISAIADNPIYQTDFTADPAPVVFGDTVFVFTSHDNDNSDYFSMDEWRCYSSTDMVNWTDRGAPMSNLDFKWAGKNAAWAAQAIERDGKYYFYITTIDNGAGARCIGVGVSDRPEGPYKDPIGKPLAGPNWDYIDPTVFIDDDGQAYLYWGNPRLYYCKLNKDMISINGQIVKTDVNSTSSHNYTEGPWVYKRKGLYYLVHASHGVPEKISYATSNSPVGPWTPRGIIMDPNNRDNKVGQFAFTIHSGVIDFKGRSFFFYHNQNLRGAEGYTGGFTRSCAVEEFTYGNDGSIPLIGTTPIGVVNPIHNLNPYNKVQAETKAFSEGLRMDYTDRKNIFVKGIDNGDYLKIRSVDFGEEGPFKFVAAVRAAGGKGGTIEVHLDKKDGEKIAQLNVPSTNNAWSELETEASYITGIHDVFITFSGQNRDMFDFDYWYFVDQSHNIPQSPYLNEPANIPGIIEAENYDLGGSGKAYYDKDSENRGKAYRQDGVDVYTTDENGGYAVGYAQDGEWLEYTVNVKETRNYKIRARLSTGNPNVGIKLFLDNEGISDLIQTDENGGEWESYLNADTETTKELTEGEHVLKIQISGDWINIDRIEFFTEAPTKIENTIDDKSDAPVTVFDSNGRLLGNEKDINTDNVLLKKDKDKAVVVGR